MKRKIVLVNQSTGYLFIDVANAFSESDYDVVLMAGDILPMNEPLNADKIKVEKIYTYDRRSTIRRFYSWIISLIKIWWLLVFKYRKHDLLLSSNPPTASTLLPIFFRRNTSLLIYDIYPDGLVAGSFVTSKSIIYKCWAWFNRVAYKRVNKIMVLTPGMATAMEAYAPKEKIKVVSAWASSTNKHAVIPPGENLFLKKYNLQDKFIIMYSGNLGKEYELESLVNLAAEFRDNQNIRFVIMGKGWKRDLLANLITERKLHNCILLPYQEPTLFLHSLNAFHIGVVSLAAAVAKVAIPSKTYNLLAAHRPIFCIGNKTSDLANFLTKNEIGVALESNEIDKMKSFVEKAYGDKEYYDKLCNNAERVAENYTREKAKEIVELVQ